MTECIPWCHNSIKPIVIFGFVVNKHAYDFLKSVLFEENQVTIQSPNDKSVPDTTILLHKLRCDSNNHARFISGMKQPCRQHTALFCRGTTRGRDIVATSNYAPMQWLPRQSFRRDYLYWRTWDPREEDIKVINRLIQHIFGGGWGNHCTHFWKRSFHGISE